MTRATSPRGAAAAVAAAAVLLLAGAAAAAAAPHAVMLPATASEAVPVCVKAAKGKALTFSVRRSAIAEYLRKGATLGACCEPELIDDFESGLNPFSDAESKWEFTPGTAHERNFPGVEFGYQGGLSAFYTLGPASALPGHEAADMLCTRGSFDLTPAHVLKLEWRADGGSILKHNFAVRLVGGADPDDEFQVTTVTSVGPRSEEAFSTPWRTAAVAMPLAHAARICLVWTLPARGEASGAYFYFDNVRLTCASAAAAGDDGGPEDEEE